MAPVEYPWWGKILIFLFIFCTIAPILFTIAVAFFKNPRQMVEGIKKKLINKYEYHPDPRRVDPKRMKTPEQIQMEILADIESENK